MITTFSLNWESFVYTWNQIFLFWRVDDVENPLRIILCFFISSPKVGLKSNESVDLRFEFSLPV